RDEGTVVTESRDPGPQAPPPEDDTGAVLAARPEIILRGLGVAPGIAFGPAHAVESGFGTVPEYVVPAADIDRECRRLEEAVAKSRRQIHKLKAKAALLPGAAAEEVGILLDAHAAMLAGSRLLRGAQARIRDRWINAEAAVQGELANIAAQFAQM